MEGRLIFLTTYFFICFIQFLQRVQQFLWGENVRGSWGGRKESEFAGARVAHFLLPCSSRFPHLHPFPRTHPGLGQWKQGGDWGLGFGAMS